MAKEVTITFFNSSVERRPCQAPAFLAPTQTITPDRISTKIVLEIYLGIGKFPLHFENHPLSADLCHRSRVQ